jgi:hypothetical protein
MKFRDAICGNRLVLSPCSPLRDVGLVNNHAYSVLDVRELPGVMPGVQTTLVDYSDWLASDKVYGRGPNVGPFCSCTSIESLAWECLPGISAYFVWAFSLAGLSDIGLALASQQRAAVPTWMQSANQAGPIRLLRIRNPWGKKEWTGDFAKKCVAAISPVYPDS